MGENMDPQAGDEQTKKPKTAGRKRRVVMATVILLAIAGLGAWAIWDYATRKPEITLDLGNNVKMRLVLIPAGTFMMGEPGSEAGLYRDEGPQHEVTISKPFYMGIHEVTQEQYEAPMGTNPPSHFRGATYPVEKVSWGDAVEFCTRVSARTGRRVMLPTEAQWEYACRARTTTRFNTGETINTDQADMLELGSAANPTAWGWFTGWIPGLRSRRSALLRPMPVGSFKPNAFGLYDMHGNASEWCADWYGFNYYSASPKTDPQGPDSGMARVVRGGSWLAHRSECRSAGRNFGDPSEGDLSGFRVVVAVD